ALAHSVSGDEIHVADGTYKPTNGTDTSATFKLTSGAAILGGYAGFGAVDPDQRDISANPTILTGDLAGNSTSLSTHVVDASGTSASTVLDGFTITRGNEAGVYNDGGALTIRNCAFSDSRVLGAVYNFDGALPKISGCTFTHNQASGYGGAIDNWN